MAFPELLAQGLEPHKVKEVYLMWWDAPEVVIDITETMDLKLKALACHASQLKDFRRREAVRERNAERQSPRATPRGTFGRHRLGVGATPFRGIGSARMARFT